MRKYGILLLQAGLSLILIGKLAADEHLRADIGKVLDAAHGRWLLAGLSLVLLSEFCCAVRWWLLLCALGTPISFKKAVIFCGAGLFFSLGLPGGAGGDAFRLLYVIRLHPGQFASISISILLDRLCGLAALCLAFLAAGLHGGPLLESNPEVFSLVLLAQWVLGTTVALLFLWWLSTLRFARKLWIPAFMSRLRQKTDHLSKIFTGILAQPRSVLAGIAASILSLTFHFSTYYYSARAFEVHVGWGQMLKMMPIVDTLVMLPISFSGVGVREILFERLLGGLYGVPTAAAVLTSVGGFLLQVFVAGVGGVLIPFTAASSSHSDH
jgi:uncharacterized membrane protein YbhN (UPF0104 family)